MPPRSPSAPARTAPVRVLIADPQPPARTGLGLALPAPRYAVAAEAADGAAAVAAARRVRPDVCLLDTGLPGPPGGIAAVEEIVAAVPGAAIVVLADRPDPDLLVDALLAGADGYLLKDVSPRRVPAVVEAVVRGEVAIPRGLVARVVAEMRARERRRRLVRSRPDAGLSARELEMLEALASGLSTADIAAAHGISPVTVRRHVSEITRKLGVPDRDAAVRLLVTDQASPLRTA